MRMICPNCSAPYRKAYRLGRTLTCPLCKKEFVAGDVLPSQAPTEELCGDLIGALSQPKEKVTDDSGSDST